MTVDKIQNHGAPFSGLGQGGDFKKLAFPANQIRPIDIVGLYKHS